MTKKSVKKKIEKAMMNSESCCVTSKMNCGSGIYGLGAIGALVYHMSTAVGFWDGVWGIIQAILWPAFLVFNLMKYLVM